MKPVIQLLAPRVRLRIVNFVILAHQDTNTLVHSCDVVTYERSEKLNNIIIMHNVHTTSMTANYHDEFSVEHAHGSGLALQVRWRLRGVARARHM